MTLTRPRIMIVGPIPPPHGGMPRYVLDLLEGDLSRHNKLLHFNTSFSSWVRAWGSNPSHARWQPGRETGLTKYSYAFASGIAGALKLFAATGLSFLRFAFLVTRYEPQVVHIVANMHWGYWRSGVYILLGRIGGSRVLFHPLGDIGQFRANSGAWARRAISLILDQADLIAVQSTGLARMVSGMTSRPVVGLFNGIHLEALGGLAHRRVFDREPLSFLAVGDLGHNKGTFDILEAAARMNRDGIDARWTFVGRGDQLAMERRAEVAGLESRVRFTGAVTEEGKIREYEKADVFLLPSYAEGQPLSILEAMAVGLPIISSTVGSIPEVVGKDNGFLVSPGDISSLEEAMRKLASDQELRARMSTANAAAAVERFDVRRLHRELNAIYGSMANEKPVEISSVLVERG